MSEYKIAVLCPTRDRPQLFQRLVDSVNSTSTKARVVGWVDEDQQAMYGRTRGADITFGPSVGPVAAMNRLAHEHRQYRLYGMVPDDAWMTTPGWDDWMLRQFDTFQNDVGVVSPHHNYGNYIDVPFVSRNWIEGIGYFAYPHLFHYAWTLATGLLGEATNIVYASEQEMHIQHEHTDSPNMHHYEGDCSKFFNHFMFHHRELILRLRSMM